MSVTLAAPAGWRVRRLAGRWRGPGCRRPAENQPVRNNGFSRAWTAGRPLRNLKGIVGEPTPPGVGQPASSGQRAHRMNSMARRRNVLETRYLATPNRRGGLKPNTFLTCLRILPVISIAGPPTAQAIQRFGPPRRFSDRSLTGFGREHDPRRVP
jgi:hypothetical protein